MSVIYLCKDEMYGEIMPELRAEKEGDLGLRPQKIFFQPKLSYCWKTQETPSQHMLLLYQSERVVESQSSDVHTIASILYDSPTHDLLY